MDDVRIPLPRPSDDVLVTDLPDGESVLLDLKTEEYFGLNELGTALWHVLDGRGDLDALVADTTTSTGVSAEVVRADLAELLELLRLRGLVVDQG